MSTNPLPDAPQPQYVTLSPDWSALLKIGRAYRLLYQFNLVWLLVIAVFFVVAAVLTVMHSADVEKSFHDSRAVVGEERNSEQESGLEPEAAIEFQATELANPAEKLEPRIPVFKGENGFTPLLILLGFFYVFLLTTIFQFVIQVFVLVRFANCPSSIVPGGHCVGMAYAICTGLFLLLAAIIAVTAGEKEDSLIARFAGPLALASFILFLVFSHKIAVAVQSQSGRRWLKILNVSICGLFFSFFIISLLAVPLALLETPELVFWGILALGMALIMDGFLIWFSFLKLFHSLGRDVSRFIEAEMADCSGQMNQQF